MKKLALMLCLAGAPGWGENTRGTWLDGNSLLSACEDALLGATCTGYIIGAIDGMNNAQLLSSLTADTPIEGVCAPDTSTRGQVSDVVIKHLKAHPEERHLSAASRVRQAMRDAFPCE